MAEFVKKTGHCNGSDMLLSVNDKAIGSCSSHDTEFSTETKERKTKPLASAPSKAGKWAGKTIVKLGININADGLVFHDETESGFKTLFALWKAAKPVDVKCFERENDAAPYLAGKFIIKNLKRTDPAEDDSTYSISLENDGEPTTLDDSKISDGSLSA